MCFIEIQDIHGIYHFINLDNVVEVMVNGTTTEAFVILRDNQQIKFKMDYTKLKQLFEDAAYRIRR